jgi:nucleotide-binding universal stress UspA family protein
MIHRILLTVDDSTPALAAARVAIALADSLGAELHAVTVAEEGHDPDRVLRHVEAQASRAGVPVTTTGIRDGSPPFEQVLSTALGWRADLIVMGRSDRRRTGRPYVGSQTEHLLEFTEIPVLVVPGPARDGPL